MARAKVVTLCVVLFGSIATAAWIGLSRIELQVRSDVGSSLQTVLITTQSGLETWALAQKTRVATWADTRDVRELIVLQAKLRRTPDELRNSSTLGALRAQLDPLLRSAAYLGFAIVAPDGITIASSLDQWLGNDSFAQQDPPTVASALAGSVALGIPFRSSHGKTGPAILVGAPVRSERVVAALFLLIDPTLDFTRVVQLGRMGMTGETYAFDRTGRLMTESRFDDQLRQTGLVAPHERGILAVQIRDPGGNLLQGFRAAIPRDQQPFTYMAQKAIEGHPGRNLDGYRDYRGVPVVGVWTWDGTLGLGLATEMDRAEAERSLLVIRWLIVAMLGVVLAGGVVAASLLWRRARRLTQGLTREQTVRTELGIAYQHLGQLNRRLESAKEDERRRLAHELHDDFGQTLTALKLRLRMHANEAEAIHLADTLITRIREISGGLRPPLLDELGLASALRAYLEAPEIAAGVATELETDGLDARLAPELEIACFRVIQEAITNVLRHAQARRVRVAVRRTDAALALLIEDDGRGFASAATLARAAAEGHLGVVGMRERVRALGGKFSLVSNPGIGTTIRVELTATQRAAPDRAGAGPTAS